MSTQKLIVYTQQVFTGERFIYPCCVKRCCLAFSLTDSGQVTEMAHGRFKLDTPIQDAQHEERQNIGVDAEFPHLEANICLLMVSRQSETL